MTGTRLAPIDPRTMHPTRPQPLYRQRRLGRLLLMIDGGPKCGVFLAASCMVAVGTILFTAACTRTCGVYMGKELRTIPPTDYVVGGTYQLIQPVLVDENYRANPLAKGKTATGRPNHVPMIIPSGTLLRFTRISEWDHIELGDVVLPGGEFINGPLAGRGCIDLTRISRGGMIDPTFLLPTNRAPNNPQ